MGVTVVVSKPGTTPGGFTRSLNDTTATNAGTSGGKENNPMDNIQSFNLSDKKGEVTEIGRGETDLDMTYITLQNDLGVKEYISVTGTTISASPTKP